MTPAPLPRTPELGSPSSPSSPLHLSDLDDILQAKNKGESIEFLHLLVDDLRHEVGVLRTQLDESEQECARLNSEIKLEQEGDRQRIQFLVETLSQVSPTEAKAALTTDQIEALSAEEASNLTIATLTRKVEELSIKNTNLVQEKVAMAERVQELEGENEAKQLKIDALELQFKAINKTRQKAVQRLTSKDRADSSAGMYGHARALVRGSY